MIGKVTVILRGYNYKQVKTVAQTLINSSIRNIEITMNTENSLEIIREINKEFGEELFIGAGTVISYKDLVDSIQAGAKFVLSPISFNKEMIDYCKQQKVISIPAAFTPTEIYNQIELGADIIKVFPANELSHNYARKVCEPLGSLPLMAVGGVNASNVKEILSSGYEYVGTAGGIFKKEDIKSKNIDGLKKSLKLFEAQIISED
ncbi:bifunctional 4-hydroxy-2-oxoglutarate aldolase/2-dehydro-3-deoxy-phosphogluconate aldolase [Irregularibacter muris]|uniref:Bifunctional 4-hydroxy-2-oxoglutarate aldolase/2-dehydro-3-deoxy-phosphogluconate aldolase n=1 Tax=Irregularibacter muris TaxID=1796619 RepID=A0AAE3HEI5_9FIRM|nr:bifunctional 4-hydroxy-2-oxoglutarate aldolase/2-dehydro-3-deoxy-phosphogluconate aldolase [Irregularibacter muris]MCR1899091.1 bifunctional 4-hydroxy-2-oxoglutarate aldolase/2-dehydro-3-deoxy-phosphogluconate aldolase [Irregularibacter muris]